MDADSNKVLTSEGLMDGWIGVDLDGTLAFYDAAMPLTYIGRPLEPMVERVKQWLKEGKQVRIVTARVGGHNPAIAGEQRILIRAWLKAQGINENIGITSEKDWTMVELWDDRAIQMVPNTGIAMFDKVFDGHTTDEGCECGCGCS